MSSGIRILLVDDHAIVREGYRRLIEKHADIAVVGEAGDAASAYKTFKIARPDVVVVDISMPGRGGIDSCASDQAVGHERPHFDVYDARQCDICPTGISRRRSRLRHEEQRA
jgi:DNA-binding NarL/FixJ family response regulator